MLGVAVKAFAIWTHMELKAYSDALSGPSGHFYSQATTTGWVWDGVDT
jgi:hypothetical protein